MNESFQNVQEPNSVETEKQLRYSDALKRFDELKAAVEEAGELTFREKPAVGEEEKTIAQLEIESEGCLGEAEACAQKGDPNGERVMQMLAQFKKAEKELLSIYFDARNESPELGEILEKDFKFLGELKDGKEDVEVEFE